MDDAERGGVFSLATNLGWCSTCGLGLDIDPRTFGDTVYRATLGAGISVKVCRDGMFAFDFSGWAPGQAPPEEDGKPVNFDLAASVVLRRTAVLNAHLAYLYTVVSRRQNFALSKMVVSPADPLHSASLDWDKPGGGIGGGGDPRGQDERLSNVRACARSRSVAHVRVVSSQPPPKSRGG